jgi:hypothetical protein
VALGGVPQQLVRGRLVAEAVPGLEDAERPRHQRPGAQLAAQVADLLAQPPDLLVHRAERELAAVAGGEPQPSAGAREVLGEVEQHRDAGVGQLEHTVQVKEHVAVGDLYQLTQLQPEVLARLRVDRSRHPHREWLSVGLFDQQDPQLRRHPHALHRTGRRRRATLLDPIHRE